MDSQTDKVAITSSKLADAIGENLSLKDVLSIHPDEHDIANADKDSEANEVNVKIEKSRSDTPNKVSKLSELLLKDALLNPEGAQQPRVPRSLLMGPTKPSKGSKKDKKTKKIGSTNPTRRNGQATNTETSSTMGSGNQPANVGRAPQTARSRYQPPKGNRIPHTVTSATVNDNRDSAGPSHSNKFSNVMIPTSDSLFKWGEQALIDIGKMTKLNSGPAAPAKPKSETFIPKRNRSSQNSPNNESASSNTPKRSKVHSRVTDANLRLQIVNNNGPIDENQIMAIETNMMKALETYLQTQPNLIPTYHTTSLRGGIVKLVCANEFSAEWIKNIIREMPPPWEGADLIIDSINPQGALRNANQKRKTIRFFIPDGLKRPSFSEATKKLQLQNQPLNTDEWIAWKMEDKGHGIFYHVTVDDNDIKLIRGNNSRLFYCFSKIKINLPRDENREAAFGNVENGMEE